MEQYLHYYSLLVSYIKKQHLDRSGGPWAHDDVTGDKYSLAVGVWEGYLTSQSLGFPLCYLRMTVLTSEFL